MGLLFSQSSHQRCPCVGSKPKESLGAFLLCQAAERGWSISLLQFVRWLPLTPHCETWGAESWEQPPTPKIPSPWPVQCSPAQLHRDGSLPSSAVKGNYHIRKGNPLNINTIINMCIMQSPGDSCLQLLFLTHGKAACFRPYHSGKKSQDVCEGWGQFWDWSFAISLLNSTKFIIKQVELCIWVISIFRGTI